MSILELEQVIQGFFRDLYNKKYIGKLTIEQLNPQGYMILFGLGHDYQPLTFYAEVDDLTFLKLLKRHIKDMRINLVDFGELNLRNPYDCAPRNTKCSCHDKG